MVGAVLDPDKTQATPGEQCCLLDGQTFRFRPRVRVKSIHENSVEPESCLSISWCRQDAVGLKSHRSLHSAFGTSSKKRRDSNTFWPTEEIAWPFQQATGLNIAGLMHRSLAGSRECSLVNLFLRKTLVICYDKFHLGPKLAYAVCVCFSWNRCCISEDCCESSCHFVDLVPSEAVTAVVFWEGSVGSLNSSWNCLCDVFLNFNLSQNVVFYVPSPTVPRKGDYLVANRF